MKQDGKNSFRTVILALVFVLLLSGLYMVGLQLYKLRDYVPIIQAATIIEDRYYYYDKISEQDRLVEDAIEGMLEGTGDDYAQYYTAEEYRELTRSQSGEFTGLGIQIGLPDENGAEILQVYPNSPMEKAGVLEGDIIQQVNGTATAGRTLEEVTALFKENAGEKDSLVLRRGETTFSVLCGKGSVYVPYVTYDMLDAATGYMRIESFLGKVASETRTALERLTAQGMDGLIIDLRDNPGGNLNDVLRTAEQFLAKGSLMVTIIARNEEEEEYFSTVDGNEEFPVVILTNGKTASAAELFTGALRDHGRATTVGTRTFGKGIVQSYFKVQSTNGYIKLTTDVYLTPNRSYIHKKGIKPDIECELPEELQGTLVRTIPHEMDTQLDKAILTLQVKRNLQQEENSNG